ncbi:MAG: methionine adenosyltransferase [Candidatus Marinimicrobia bacterium]|nr:methionine adenosyltransferase [Candidatus Neomarinimicrobiota bacterium]|tara:strand:- start:19673 stop:20869 length:1197 start_codon:yes stop_codon:yes gene_type:complete
MKNYLFSSESVTEGHPDKVCDQISDAILDALLEQDEDSRVACETMITTGWVIVSAEITTQAKIDYDAIIRKTLDEIGYLELDLGTIKMQEDSEDKLWVSTLIKNQSPHIAQGVDLNDKNEQGAGDQGLMFGFACNETPELMPLPITLSHRLSEQLAKVRKDGTLSWLKPDGKSQVTIEYDSNEKPVRVKKVVIATQHIDMLNEFKTEEKEHEFIKSNIIKHVILPVLDNYGIPYDSNFLVNGTGRFVEGGPIADVGLTGRKIIVDTYGGYAKHGGGAFSGKDPSKVDRSAAYMTRYIAKNIVAAKLADKCEVQVAYCIGVAEPMSVNVNTFKTGVMPDNDLVELINKVFDLKPDKIIEHLDLKKPIYRQLAAYGHFGRGDNYRWEITDKKEELSNYLK